MLVGRKAGNKSWVLTGMLHDADPLASKASSHLLTFIASAEHYHNLGVAVGLLFVLLWPVRELPSLQFLLRLQRLSLLWTASNSRQNIPLGLSLFFHLNLADSSSTDIPSRQAISRVQIDQTQQLSILFQFNPYWCWTHFTTTSSHHTRNIITYLATWDKLIVFACPFIRSSSTSRQPSPFNFPVARSSSTCSDLFHHLRIISNSNQMFSR